MENKDYLYLGLMTLLMCYVFFIAFQIIYFGIIPFVFGNILVCYGLYKKKGRKISGIYWMFSTITFGLNFLAIIQFGLLWYSYLLILPAIDIITAIMLNWETKPNKHSSEQRSLPVNRSSEPRGSPFK